MDFDTLKKLINSDRERVIVVENGKPVAVLLSFDEYQKKFRNYSENESENEFENEFEEKEPHYRLEELPVEKKKEFKKELTIEDLPF